MLKVSVLPTLSPDSSTSTADSRHIVVNTMTQYSDRQRSQSKLLIMTNQVYFFVSVWVCGCGGVGGGGGVGASRNSR